MVLANLNLVIAVTAALGCIGFALSQGPSEFSWILLLALPFLVFPAAPFACLAFFAWGDRQANLAVQVYMLLVGIAAASFCYSTYMDFANRTSFDAQDGLILVVVPFMTLAGVIAARALLKIFVR